MRVLDLHSAARELARLLQKPCLAFNIYTGNGQIPRLDDVLGAAPWLNRPNSEDDTSATQALLDDCGIVVCDSVQEMGILYENTVGDDGPTATNPYHAPVRVYAVEI